MTNVSNNKCQIAKMYRVSDFKNTALELRYMLPATSLSHETRHMTHASKGGHRG